MRELYKKTALAAIAALFCWGGVGQADAQTNYSALLNYDYSTDAQVATWTSGNTGRYTVNKYDLSGNSFVHIAPVSNGNNGTTATTTAIADVGTNYTSSEDYKVEFDFNIAGSSNQAAWLDIYDTDGKVLVSFKQTTANATAGTIVDANSTKLGDFTFSKCSTIPSSFCNATIIGNATDGTQLTLTTANETTNTTVTYTLSKDLKHVGKIVYNTKRYYGHFIFDNLKVSIAVAADYVPAPTATVTAVNGTSRTITITPAEDAVDGTSILYYTSSDDADDAAKHSTYSAPFTTSDATSIYYYANYNGNKSEVKTLTTTAGTNATVRTPSIKRTGDNSYTVSATATTVDGIVATQTLHYTVAGGTEQTSTEASVALTDVTGDITAYATSSNGFSQSETASLAYVAPYAGYEAWAYNLNSYPSTYSVTAIANAIASTSVTLNDIEVYNLKEIAATYPDLYVDNSSAWLLRNQSTSAFKSQSGKGNIVINNVTANDMIRIDASSDGGKNSIASVTNGVVSYSYSGKYFVKPSTDGAVTVTLNTGTAINTVAVLKNAASLTVTDAKYATYVTPAALDFSNTDVKAFAVKYDNGNISYDELTTVPANTAILVYAASAGTYSIPVASTAEALTGNSLMAATSAVACDGTQYILAKIDGTLGWYQANEGTIAAGKGYLSITTTEAKAFYPLADNAVTAIEAVNSKDMVKGQNAYNLAGQRVNSSYKGVVVKGGRKYIIK